MNSGAQPAEPSPRPVALKVKLDDIPDDLAQQRAWVLWEYKRDGDRWTKVPFARKLHTASTTDPRTWNTLDAMAATYRDGDGGFDGIGLVLQDDVVGVDLDHVIDPTTGELADWAAQLLDDFHAAGAYIERSPSNTGYHILCRGKVPRSGKGGPGNHLETYAIGSPRYFTVTGHVETHDGQVGDVVPAQSALDAMFARHFQPKEAPPRPPRPAQDPRPRLHRKVNGHDGDVENDLHSALMHLADQGDASSYDTWIEHGIALADLADVGFRLWCDFSARDPRFDPDQCELKWRTFKPNNTGYRAIFAKAQRTGWINPKSQAPRPNGPPEEVDPVGAGTAAPTEEEIAATFDGADELVEDQQQARQDVETEDGLPKAAEAHLRAHAATLSTWPDPYPTFMAQICEAILADAPKPQPQITTLSALIAMSTTCGSGYCLKRAAARVNLYGLGVLETGGGKDTPFKAARRIARAAGASVLDRPGSAAGLEDALIPRKGMLVSVDECAGMLASMNDEKAPSYLKELGGLFLRLFSAGNDTHVCRALKSEKRNTSEPPPEVQNPAVNLLMFSTGPALARAMTQADAENGFIGRLLFAHGQPNVKTRLDFAEISMAAEVFERARLVAAVNNRAGAAGMEPVKIAESAEAEAHRHVINDRLHGEGEADRNNFGAAVRARHLEICDRVAGTLAVWDNPEHPVVQLDHLKWADEAVTASNASMLSIVRGLGSDERVHEARRVLLLIRRLASGAIPPPRASHARHIDAGFVPLAAITLRATLPGMKLKAALEFLEMAGLVNGVRSDAPTRGFPATLYQLIDD